ncbi:MAG: arginine--tRNA ligase [Planctomycetota bacterium]
MNDLLQTIEAHFRALAAQVLGVTAEQVDPRLKASARAEFGDLQLDGAMALAKPLGKKPRELAEALRPGMAEMAELAKVDVAGPGFLNLTLEAGALGAAMPAQLLDARLGVFPAEAPRKVVLDYASPNLAKEMHIGHLRSTILGDAIGRVLEARGHAVVRQNHVGDWGTQFGMLLEHLIDTGWSADDGGGIADLNTLYQEAKKRDDADKDFAQRARQRVVALQSGDAEARKVWRSLIDESVAHMERVFDRLGVELRHEHLCPESFYNDRLAGVAGDLESAGVAVISDGALCAFVEGREHPLIVRKGDGGFGYGATDLAAVRYRAQDLGADRLVYVVDSRQKDHFEKFFDVARRAGWAAEGVSLEHVGFGTILGKDNRPFKTREGGTVRLTDVLDEAVKRAGEAALAKGQDTSGAERQDIAEAVGLGAVKYADLSNDRIKDYVFDWDRMLALEGNTAPYLLYSYARIRSIFRKGEVDYAGHAPVAVSLDDPAERALGVHLIQFGQAVASVDASLEPHRLCNYLYELAVRFHRFFERCPVLKAKSDALRQSRLTLAKLTAEVLHRGLSLLGIRTLERM